MRRMIASLALMFASCSQPESASVEVLVGGRLIDGRGGPPLEYPVVIVEGGKILDVGPQTHVKIPQGSRKVDTTGLTIRPGKADGRIEAGAPADIELVTGAGVVSRRMAGGQWQ